jgi:superoxide dismutase, Fe-Mn family
MLKQSHALPALVFLAFAAVTMPASALPQAAVATQAPALPVMGPFTLPPLPYAYDALASVIDAQTMELHHQRHHKAQVDGLNTALAVNPILAGQSLEQLLARASTLPPAVRNNAGGHWNHSFFWTIMAPIGQGGAHCRHHPRLWFNGGF